MEITSYSPTHHHSYRLLSLDGSAHLQSYRRSLGPQREPRSVPNNEMAPRPASRPNVPPIDIFETHITKHRSFPRIQGPNNLQNIPHRTVAPMKTTEPTRPHPYAVTKPAPPRPVPPPYPLALRQALERAYGAKTPSTIGVRYLVIRAVEDRWAMETEVIASSTSLREANGRAAEYFVNNVWDDRAGMPVFVVRAGGKLRCEMKKGEELGVGESVFVKDAWGS